MAELPSFESPVPTIFVSYAGIPIERASPDAPLTLQDVSSMTKTIVRAARGTKACRQMSVPFGASRTKDGVLVVGQRPDEWLLLGQETAIQVLLDRLDSTGHVNVIGNTHSRALFRLTGADSASVLEKLCSLDWNDRMTPDGAAV